MNVPTSGTLFCGNLVMATFPHPLIQEEQFSVTGQRKCTKITGKLHPGGLPRNLEAMT